MIKWHKDTVWLFTDANSSYCFSFLVIVSTSNLSLVRYDLGQRLPLRIISYDNGTGQSLFVFEDGTIYWVIYDLSSDYYLILCTSPMGETRALSIHYREEILVVVSRLYIYVLVIDSNRIDIYSKKTLMKHWELQITSNVNELILALGKLIMTEI